MRPSQSPDVVIIGGGIIGCSIGLRLAQAKMKVTVVDRGQPGGEASSAAAGMLAPQGETVTPDAYFELARSSRDLYPSFVAEVEELSGQTVGYRCGGTLLVARSDQEVRELDAVFSGQTAYGLPLERLTADAARARVPALAPEIRSALFIAGDHSVDNEKLTAALAEAALRAGVKFHSRAAVTRFHARGRPASASRRIESIELAPGTTVKGKKLSAASFILAAGCWSAELVAPLGVRLPMSPCRGQMIEFESAGEAEIPLVVRAGHHYLVPREGGRVLAGTTAEYAGFDKAVTGEGLASILEGVRRLAPAVKHSRFRRAWAGLRPDTADHLPVLGCGEIKNLIFATGHFRNGILLAPITAQVITELILMGSTSLSIAAYGPARFC
ncbi:MAG: glycine oxidase ThiO [Acidobacteria bacterium]|nr:MAG: glycine oxidase ThiO [Acidobacteriota bacterium]